jgi:hypothetical protein
MTIHFPAVCADRERRTCLALDGSGSTVQFIPLSIENGFQIESMPRKTFDEVYKHLEDYPPARCATLYAQYAMSVGATAEAMEALGRITKLTQKEIEMATAKKAPTAKVEKVTAEKPAKVAKVAAEKAEKPAKVAKVAAEKAEKPAKKTGVSAAQMFRDLIMAGNLSDAKIFEKVQAAHGLSDDKASYVAWYRKDMIKKGAEGVPEAKPVKAAK